MACKLSKIKDTLNDVLNKDFPELKKQIDNMYNSEISKFVLDNINYFKLNNREKKLDLILKKINKLATIQKNNLFIEIIGDTIKIGDTKIEDKYITSITKLLIKESGVFEEVKTGVYKYIQHDEQPGKVVQVFPFLHSDKSFIKTLAHSIITGDVFKYNMLLNKNYIIRHNDGILEFVNKNYLKNNSEPDLEVFNIGNVFFNKNNKTFLSYIGELINFLSVSAIVEKKIKDTPVLEKVYGDKKILERYIDIIFGINDNNLFVKKTLPKRAFDSMYTLTSSMWGFFKYTLGTTAGLVLGLLSILPIKSTLKAMGLTDELRNKLDKVRKDMGIVDGGIYNIKYTAMTELYTTTDYFSKAYDGIVDMIGKSLSGTLSEKQVSIIMDKLYELKGGIHNVIETMFLDDVKTAAFKQVLNNRYGINDDMLRKGELRYNENTGKVEFIYNNGKGNNIIILGTKDEVNSMTNDIVKMHRGYNLIPLYNHFYNRVFDGFNKYFNFYGKWGTYMLNNFVNGIAGYPYYAYKYAQAIKSGDKEMIDYYKRMYEQSRDMFEIIMGQFIQSAWYGAQLNKFQDNDCKNDDALCFARTLVNSMKVFSSFLQMFDSSIYGRIMTGIGEGLTHEDKAAAVGLNMLEEVKRDFLKNIHILDSIPQAVRVYLDTNDPEKAKEIIQEGLFGGSGFVRFLDNYTPEYFQDYTAETNENELMNIIKGEPNKIKGLYNFLRTDRDIIKFKERTLGDNLTNIVGTILDGLPLIKGWIKGGYGESVLGKYGKILDTINEDKILIDYIYNGIVPSGDDLPTEKQEEYNKYVLDISRKFFKYGSTFKKDEILQLSNLYTNDRFLEDNIFALYLKKLLKDGDNVEIFNKLKNEYLDIITNPNISSSDKRKKEAEIAFANTLAASENNVPGSSYKLLGYIMNKYSDYLTQKYSGGKYKYFNQLADNDPNKTLIETELSKKFVNIISYIPDGKTGSINGLVAQQIANKYISLKYPQLKDFLVSKKGYIKEVTDPIFRLLLTKTVIGTMANMGDVSVIEAKNILSLLGLTEGSGKYGKLNQEDRAKFLGHVLDMINKTNIGDKETKTNMMLGVLSNNIDILNDIVDNAPENIKSDISNVRKKLVDYIFHVNKNINDIAKKVSIDEELNKNTKKKIFRSSYPKNRSFYNGFKKWYGNKYPSLYNKYGKSGYRYYPKDVYIPRQYSKPEYKRPEYKKNTYPARLMQAFSRRIIYELKKDNEPREYRFKGYNKATGSIFSKGITGTRWTKK